jgi:hypothetical protein
MIARRRALLLLAAAATAACVNLGDDEPSVTLWETQLTAEIGFPGLTGQAAAVSAPDGTQVGIGIDGAEEGAAHAWALLTGTCAQPGLQVGPQSDYPDLTVDPSGHAEADTHLGPRLDFGGTYLVEVRVSAADPTRVACGDLAQP